MKMFRKDEGFTLVELMVVVLIIGILVAIAIPVFNAASATARLRTCQSNQRTIEGAVQQWVAADPANQATACAAAGWKTLLVSSYIKTIPQCPASKKSYNLDATGATVNGDEDAATWYVDGSTTHAHF